MLVSLVKQNNVYEICIHAEQVFTNLQISKRNPKFYIPERDDDEKETEIVRVEKGIFCSTITFSTLKKIIKAVSEIKEYCILILDFNFINRSQKNSHILYQDLFQSIKDKTLILRNLNKDVVDSFILEKFHKEEKPFFEEIIINQKAGDEIIGETIKDLFTKTFEEKLMQYFADEEFEYHYSSSVYLNRFIDIKTLLNSNDKFILYCLYKLALKTIHSKSRGWVINEQNNDYTLFCQTINGAFIASILSELLLLDLTFIDHLGPINKIYNSFNSDVIIKNVKYLVISDVICLGTEVKIAKNLIEYTGGKYCGNISLIRVKAAMDKDKIYSNVEYLYEISKKRNILNYEVKTALDFNEE